MASAGTLTAGLTSGCVAAQLHARQVSCTSATCSYTATPARPRHQRSRVTLKAAQTEIAESSEDSEELSDEITALLAPRTVPTPVLSPQEVSPASFWRMQRLHALAALREAFSVLVAAQCGLSATQLELYSA